MSTNTNPHEIKSEISQVGELAAHAVAAKDCSKNNYCCK
jgi:hypothetical protein